MYHSSCRLKHHRLAVYATGEVVAISGGRVLDLVGVFRGEKETTGGDDK